MATRDALLSRQGRGADGPRLLAPMGLSSLPAMAGCEAWKVQLARVRGSGEYRGRTWRQSSRADERRQTTGGAHTAGRERHGEGLAAANQSRSLPPQGQRPNL